MLAANGAAASDSWWCVGDGVAGVRVGAIVGGLGTRNARTWPSELPAKRRPASVGDQTILLILGVGEPGLCSRVLLALTVRSRVNFDLGRERRCLMRGS